MASSSDHSGIGPKNIGILAVEVYTPRTYIQQSQLEEHAGVATGKYTIGLGQDGMAVTGDAEDINSICLTAVAGLLEKYVPSSIRAVFSLHRRCRHVVDVPETLRLAFD